MKKWVFRLLIVICVLGVGSLLLSFGDEDLYPQATALVEQTRVYPSAEHNGFYTLIAGLDVAADEQPGDVGQDIIKRYESALSTVSPGQDVVFDLYPDDKRMAMSPELGRVCDVKEEHCLLKYQQQSAEIATLVAEHDLVMQRYKRLQQYNEIVTACTNSYFMPLPNLSGVIRIHNLLQADIGARFMAGEVAEAVIDLTTDLAFQRRLLKQADNLLLKMVALNFLGRDIHLYAQMLDAGAFSAHQYPDLMAQLTPLEGDELALTRALQSEFLASAHLFLSEFATQDIFSTRSAPGGDGRSSANYLVSAIAGFVAFKPNATLNTVYDQLLRADAEFTALSGANLINKLKPSSGPGGASSTDMIDVIFTMPFNPIGNILTQIAAPDFTSYRARIHDFDGLLRLAELKRRLRADGVTTGGIQSFLDSQPSELRNPYNTEPMDYDAERQVLRFSGLGINGDSARWRSEIAMGTTL